MKRIIMLCMCAMMLCSCGTEEKETEKAVSQNINCAQKEELMNEGAILIDVRSASEYAEGHLDNSINLTVDTKNVTVESSDDATWYTASIKNSSDLQYLVITVKITDKEYIAKKCKLIVNDKEVSSKKITIDGNTITYKMDDPNWSDFI